MTGSTGGRILVVEHDRERGDAIARQLLADGYRVEMARTAEHARVLASAFPPSLALLGDLGTPRGALGLLEEIRESSHRHTPWDRRLPAIVVGPRANELDLLRAFESGADDYLARPLAYLELRARLRAILRRAGEGRADVRRLSVGALAIDTYTREVTLNERSLELRRMEFELLTALAREPSRVFTREELLRDVWGYRADCSTRTVDGHASRLRRKLEVDSRQAWVIGVWGVGYRLT